MNVRLTYGLVHSSQCSELNCTPIKINTFNYRRFIPGAFLAPYTGHRLALLCAPCWCVHPVEPGWCFPCVLRVSLPPRCDLSVYHYTFVGFASVSCFAGYLFYSFYSHGHSFTNHRSSILSFSRTLLSHWADWVRVYLGGHPFSVWLLRSFLCGFAQNIIQLCQLMIEFRSVKLESGPTKYSL